MKEKVLEICQEYCDGKIANENEDLFESGLLNSYRLLELLCELENAFSIEFLPEEMNDTEHFSTIVHMVDLIEHKIVKEEG